MHGESSHIIRGAIVVPIPQRGVWIPMVTFCADTSTMVRQPDTPFFTKLAIVPSCPGARCQDLQILGLVPMGIVPRLPLRH